MWEDSFRSKRAASSDGERLRAENAVLRSRLSRLTEAILRISEDLDLDTLLGASSPLDPAETRQFFRIIEEQADHMRDLINNLLGPDPHRVRNPRCQYRTHRCSGFDRPGAQRVPKRRLSQQCRDGLDAEHAPSRGGRPADRAGPSQLALQRIKILPRVVRYTSGSLVPRCPCRGFGCRRRTRDRRRTPTAPVHQVLPD